MNNHLESLRGQKIVFIGGGNMATALIDGLVKARNDAAVDFEIGVVEPSVDKKASFEAMSVRFATPDAAHDLLSDASVVVLAVKPQVMQEVCAQFDIGNALIISIAAGLSLDKLSAMTGKSRIVRTMPNLPASVGFGATGLFACAVSTEDKQIATAVMGASGVAVWVPKEDDLHTVTAVAGSAPAYFFYVLKHMIKKAVELGLDEDAARQLASQTMQGAAIMAKTEEASALQAKVTSKGGTTFAAITHMDEQKMGQIIEEAMAACYARSVELGS